MHCSPAGLHGGIGGAHVPPMHWLSQQSLGAAHDAPATPHGASPQARDAGPESFASHPSEQHWPAYEQARPTPRHPVAGWQVVSPMRRLTQSPEQHSSEV
jgi:hypothetical protein